jgi:WD40 repeat protein
VCGRELDVQSIRLDSGEKEPCYTTWAVYPSLFAFSPNGHILAIGGVHYLQGDGLDYVHRLDVWHKTELDPIRTDVNCLAYSPDSKKLATGNFVNTVNQSAGMRIWEGKRLTVEFGPSANHLAWSSDGRLAWGAAQQLNIVRPGTGEPVRSWCGSSGGLSAITFSPDNRLLLTGTDSGLCSLHDISDAEARVALDWGIGPIHSVAFSPDGLTCAAGGEKGQVVLWDVDE